MVRRVSFSGQEQDLADIARTFNLLRNSLVRYRDRLLNEVAHGTLGNVPPNLVGCSIQEVEEYFANEIEELERLLSFNVIAATEARFKKDYLLRVYNRRKDELSHALRVVYSEVNKSASLEDDILATWKELEPSIKPILSDYIGALGYRHWLAHGRYWVAKIGRKYDFFTVYAICDNVNRNVPFLF